MKKNKMTVYSDLKIMKPQEHYNKLLRDSSDLIRILDFLGSFGEPLKIFLRLFWTGKYDGACKVLINCFKSSHLYTVDQLQSLYLSLIDVSDRIDPLLWAELEALIKQKGLVLV